MIIALMIILLTLILTLRMHYVLYKQILEDEYSQVNIKSSRVPLAE